MSAVVKVLVGLFLTLPVAAYVVGTRVGPPVDAPAPGAVATAPSESPHRGVPAEGAVAENPDLVTGVPGDEVRPVGPRQPAVADRRTPEADPGRGRQARGQSFPAPTTPVSSASPTADSTAAPEETATPEEPAQTPRETATETPEQSTSPTPDGTATGTPSG